MWPAVPVHMSGGGRDVGMQVGRRRCACMYVCQSMIAAWHSQHTYNVR